MFSFKNIFWILFLIIHQVNAQHDENWRDVLEKYTENSEQEFDYQDLNEQLSMLAENPIDLNKTNSEELQKLFFLNPAQIAAILSHSQEFGKFISLYELQVIPVLDDETIRRMLPFVTIHAEVFEPINWQNLKEKGKHELSNQHEREWPKNQAYLANTYDSLQSSKFTGSPDRIVLRYRFTYKNRFSAGFSAEKDAGEPFFRSYNKDGFDFYTAHVFYRGNGLIKNVAIGDYQASFGQMLTFGTGMSFGKSSMVLQTKKNIYGLRPYKSINENSFLRGAAITLAIKNNSLTVFYSRLSYDANINNNDAGESIISSINLSGLHRNSSEESKRKELKIQTTGFNLQHQRRNLAIGITTVALQFDNALSPNKKIYTLYDEKGASFIRSGLYYDWHHHNFNIYGESSYDLKGEYAHVVGMTISLGRSFDINSFYRNYSKAYTALFNNGIGENSGTRNEEGVYMGCQFRINRQWTYLAYYDLFRFPWARYQAESPSAGKEYFSEIQYKPNKKTLIYLRFKEETKAFNLPGFTTVRQQFQFKRQIRWHMDYQGGEFIKMKTRFEVSKYKNQLENYYGSMVFQDVQVKFPQVKTTVTARFSIFNVDDYESRIYSFENDIPYSFSMMINRQSGVRTYILLNHQFNKHFQLWIRCYSTYYSNQHEIGSGNTLIPGNKRNGVSWLFKYTF